VAVFREPNLVGKKNSWSNLISVVAFLVFASGMLASYFYNKYILSEVETEAIAEGICDLRAAPCISVFPNGNKVSFSIKPNTIPILQPLTLSVETKGFEVSSVRVDFIGLNMDMGINRSVLKAKNTTHYEGEFIIPICVNSRMEWEARVRLKTDDGVLMAPFRFYTTK